MKIEIVSLNRKCFSRVILVVNKPAFFCLTRWVHFKCAAYYKICTWNRELCSKHWKNWTRKRKYCIQKACKFIHIHCASDFVSLHFWIIITIVHATVMYMICLWLCGRWPRLDKEDAVHTKMHYLRWPWNVRAVRLHNNRKYSKHALNTGFKRKFVNKSKKSSCRFLLHIATFRDDFSRCVPFETHFNYYFCIQVLYKVVLLYAKRSDCVCVSVCVHRDRVQGISYSIDICLARPRLL